MGIKADTVAIRMEDAGLEGAEKATTTRDRQDHAAEFAQDLLPGLERDAFAAAKVVENGTQTLVAVWRQLQGLLGSIDKPTEENFGRAPATVALEEFLNGDGLLMKGVGRIQGANDFIDSMEQDTSRDTSATGITLNQVAEIINVNIGVTQGKGVRLATGNGSRGQGRWHTGHTSGETSRTRKRRRQGYLIGRRGLDGGTRAQGTRAR
jgi:hypothetical protein